MNVIYEDSVDWEPLHLRFVIAGSVPLDQSESLAGFVVGWMRQRERDEPEKWRLCEYSSETRSSGTIDAFCEHMPPDEVQLLADAVASRFPFVSELRLGERTETRALNSIDWMKIAGDHVEIDGICHDVETFTIGFSAVTVGHYCEFIDATGYVPVPDKFEYLGYTIGHFRLNYGKSPKIPLFGLTFDDAIAFCDWGGFRLPTDPELRLFYETINFKFPKPIPWDGLNWTSTAAGPDEFYVRQGPLQYHPLTDKDQFRRPLNRHHYQHLEAPAFRIVQR